MIYHYTAHSYHRLDHSQHRYYVQWGVSMIVTVYPNERAFQIKSFTPQLCKPVIKERLGLFRAFTVMIYS